LRRASELLPHGPVAALPGAPSTWLSLLAAVQKLGETFKFSKMSQGTMRDIPHAAIDFHCSNMVTLTKHRVLLSMGVDEELLRSLVWQKRSSVTNKTFLDGTVPSASRANEDLWRQILPIVEDFSRAFLTRKLA